MRKMAANEQKDWENWQLKFSFPAFVNKGSKLGELSGKSMKAP